MSDSIDAKLMTQRMHYAERFRGRALMRTESRVTLSSYASPVALVFKRSAIAPALIGSVTTGIG